MVKTKTKAKLPPIASADAMMMASTRANARAAREKSAAYYYGNMGDSIERRYNGFGDGGLLGGGNDAFQGTFGGGGSWNANGGGNYYGSGLLNGYGRMFSGVHNGMGGGFTYLKKFSSNAAFIHSVIAQCQLAYFGYGVVKNIIDLYADFASEGLVIEHEDSSVRNFYKTWAQKIKLNERIHKILLSLFISGNVFIHRRWATLSGEEQRAMKRNTKASVINNTLVLRVKNKDISISRDIRDSEFIDWVLSNKSKPFLDKAKSDTSSITEIEKENNISEPNAIPWEYTLLNPLSMELRGRKLRGDSYWIMAVDKKDVLDIARGLGMRSKQDLGSTEINLPKEFLARIKAYQGSGSGFAAEVKLTDTELSVLQAPSKFDWFDWAIPFIFPCLRTLYFKDCLRTMEIKACESVINSIFLFKLGRIKDGMPAEDEHFERLADMLQMPGQTMNILWNEAIEAQVLQPNLAGIFDVQKHESADKDILTALGIPEVLLGGKGGNFSNSYIAVATVLERLESYRNIILDWLMGEMKLVSDTMKFKKLPTIKFGRTSLQDEKSFQSFLTALFDRNILSADTLLQQAETNVEIEVSKLKEEKSLRTKDVLEPRGPYIKPPPPPGGGPPGTGPQKSMPKTPNGRPDNSETGPTGQQSNPRGPKGKGLADVLELHEIISERGKSALSQIENFVGQNALKAKAKENPNLKHLKQLKLEERDRLEQLIYNVFSHMPAPDSSDPLKDEFIINMLNSDAASSVKADVLEIYTNKISDYSKTYGKIPTREMRRQFIVSAWTQKAIMSHIASKPDILRN